MCELFGITAKNEYDGGGLLKEFFSHSELQPHGWGLAVCRGRAVSLEKEPVKAYESQYLHHRLSRPVVAKTILAHIRYATIGLMDYSNCHPFVWDDASGRTWTLMHNGTLFDADLIQPYAEQREGTTDSEGILLLLVQRVNEAMEQKAMRHGHFEKYEDLNREERFQIFKDLVYDLAKGNKLNLLLFDGEQVYVHTNQEGTLYSWEREGFASFVTRPLTKGTWQPLPMCTPLLYRNGERVDAGEAHAEVFRQEDHDWSFIHGAYAGL